MATQAITVDTVNFTELQQALDEAPIESWRFAKNEMGRFAGHVRRKTIQSMTGRPAVKGPRDAFGRAKGETKSIQAKSPTEPLYGGQFKRGKHIQGFATGADLVSLKAVCKISRILRVHEEGGTITAKGGGFLFLSRKTGTSGSGIIFGRVKSVTIPPRLHFTQIWEQEIPIGAKSVMDGIERAMHVVLERRMQALTSNILAITSL